MVGTGSPGRSSSRGTRGRRASPDACTARSALRVPRTRGQAAVRRKALGETEAGAPEQSAGRGVLAKTVPWVQSQLLPLQPMASVTSQGAPGDEGPCPAQRKVRERQCRATLAQCPVLPGGFLRAPDR